MSGEDIYRNFTEARGGEGLAGAAEMVKQLVGEYEQQADEIIDLTGVMESAWQGDAAGAAQRGAGPLAVAHSMAAPEIDKAQDLSVRQVGSFGDAKSAVRPVPPEPTAPDPWMMVFSPDVTTTYAGQVAAHNTAAQHNVDVMSGYDNASSFNTGGLPSSYGTLAADSADVTVGSPDSGPITPPPPPPNPGPGGPSPAGGGNPGQGPQVLDQPGPSARSADGEAVPGGGPGGPPQPGPGAGPGGALPPQGTDPASFRPPVVGPGGGPGDGPLPPSGLPVPGGQGGGLGVGVIGPVGGLGTGGGTGAGPGVGGRGGGALPGGGGGGAGGEGGRAGGGRGGVGPIGGVPGEGVATRGGAAVPGARGGPGGMPVGGAGGGKGSGGEDEEHERASFLQEPDPEATFGTDEQTAPPVIQ